MGDIDSNKGTVWSKGKLSNGVVEEKDTWKK